MGNPKMKWTAEEEKALKAGVAKHGTGKWQNILRDPQFSHLLYSRSNIDLKDKWRNMSVANGQNPREKSRVVKPKADPDAPVTPLQLTQASASIALVPIDAPTHTVVVDSSKCLPNVKAISKYNEMIYKALSTMKDPNGLDVTSLVNFIENRHEVPPNFRRLLTNKLRRLVQQGKIEKTLKGYRMKSNIMPNSEEPSTPKHETLHHQRQSQMISVYHGDSLQDAATHAAYRVAEAENKSFVAAEAVKEAERVADMAEDADSFLQLAEHIFERCSNREIVMIA